MPPENTDTGAAAAAAAADAAAAATAAAAAKTWYDGADAETLGYIQNRGLTDKSPLDAFVNARQGHLEATKALGIPVAQVLRVPTEASDEAGWKNVWSRLGTPDDVTGYDLSTVKIGETDMPAALSDALKATALSAHLPKDAATAVATGVAKYLAAEATEKAAVAAAALETERVALKANWGANFDANRLVCLNAAKALGVTEEDVGRMEATIGYSRTMEMFRNIGSKIGEDKFVNSTGPLKGIMTKEQAVSGIAELKNDTAFVTRYMAGDAEAARQMAALHVAAYGDDTAESRGF